MKKKSLKAKIILIKLIFLKTESKDALFGRISLISSSFMFHQRDYVLRRRLAYFFFIKYVYGLHQLSHDQFLYQVFRIKKTSVMASPLGMSTSSLQNLGETKDRTGKKQFGLESKHLWTKKMPTDIQ